MGGIKEKILAAKRAGITDIVLPKYLVEIGEEAFKGSDVTSILMPTSLATRFVR